MTDVELPLRNERGNRWRYRREKRLPQRLEMGGLQVRRRERSGLKPLFTKTSGSSNMPSISPTTSIEPSSVRKLGTNLGLGNGARHRVGNGRIHDGRHGGTTRRRRIGRMLGIICVNQTRATAQELGTWLPSGL